MDPQLQLTTTRFNELRIEQVPEPLGGEHWGTPVRQTDTWMDVVVNECTYKRKLNLYITESLYIYNLSFLSFILFFRLDGSFMAPIISSVKSCALGRQRPFSPSVPVCLLLWPVFMCSSQGTAYTVSWLVGVQIKVML